MVRAARRAVALRRLLCVVIFLVIAIFAVGSIVFRRSTGWRCARADRQGARGARAVLDLYKNLERFIDRTSRRCRARSGERHPDGADRDAQFDARPADQSAPHAMIQLFFALLVIFFFLAGWTAMRKQTIVSRGSFEGALTTARVIQQVVARPRPIFGTITVINVTLGALTALILWWLGMDSPLMWGGIVAVLNYIPYLGPIASALLLFFGGLMTFPTLGRAAAAGDLRRAAHGRGQFHHPADRRQAADDQPAADPHRAELLGVGVGHDRRAARVPLLIIMKTVFAAAGTPDIAGFLFEEGTLTHVGEHDEEEDASAPGQGLSESS
jgi:hypothetical protein